MIKSPERIQRKRSKGWKIPENTVYVGRPTKWGNPYYVHQDFFRDASDNFRCSTALIAVKRYESTKGISFIARAAGGEGWLPDVARAELRGKNLACWCPLDKPCHADVLLRIANE